MLSVTPTAALVPTTAARPVATGPDHLAQLRAPMSLASAGGPPVDPRGAAEVLATGASYLHGARSTVARLDEGIDRRTRALAELERSDPGAAAAEREQVDLLTRLRDRIQLSAERVGDLLAGRERDDIGRDVAGSEPAPRESREARRREELALLEQRRSMLSVGLTPGVGGAASPLTA